MTKFDDREKAFEAKYRQDQEIAFKVNARRNKLLGLWAAELMGLGKDDAAAYAREVVESDFDKPGDEDVLQKVLKDFTARGVDMSEHRLRKEMDRLQQLAMEQVRKEAKPGTPEGF
ncbi:MAG: DUF1476 domain-containing protein [Alphaproteobacteria bacterium]